MNKERYAVYLEGFENCYWEVDHEAKKAFFSFGSPIDHKWRRRIFSFDLTAAGVYKSEEFQEALKTWDNIKNSPLIKALA